MHDQAPLVVSAVHADPELDQLPVELSVSDIDDAVAYDNWTDAPIGADPVNVNVRVVVMLSVVIDPLSDAAERSGTATAGRA